MQNVTFALPTLPTNSMSTSDQSYCLVNQATAVIVCCYLEHMNTLVNKNPAALTGIQVIDQTELLSLINTVQTALRNVTSDT